MNCNGGTPNKVVANIRFEVGCTEIEEKFEFRLIGNRIFVQPVDPSHPQSVSLRSFTDSEDLEDYHKSSSDLSDSIGNYRAPFTSPDIESFETWKNKNEELEGRSDRYRSRFEPSILASSNVDDLINESLEQFRFARVEPIRGSLPFERRLRASRYDDSPSESCTPCRSKHEDGDKREYQEDLQNFMIMKWRKLLLDETIRKIFCDIEEKGTKDLREKETMEFSFSRNSFPAGKSYMSKGIHSPVPWSPKKLSSSRSLNDSGLGQTLPTTSRMESNLTTPIDQVTTLTKIPVTFPAQMKPRKEGNDKQINFQETNESFVSIENSGQESKAQSKLDLPKNEKMIEKFEEPSKIESNYTIEESNFSKTIVDQPIDKVESKLIKKITEKDEEPSRMESNTSIEESNLSMTELPETVSHRQEEKRIDAVMKNLEPPKPTYSGKATEGSPTSKLANSGLPNLVNSEPPKIAGSEKSTAEKVAENNLKNYAQLPSKVETSPRTLAVITEIDKVKPNNYAQLPSKVETSPKTLAVSNDIDKIKPNNYSQLPSKVDTSPRTQAASNEIDKVKPNKYAQLPSKVETSPKAVAASNEIDQVKPNNYTQLPSKVETSPRAADVSNEIDKVKTNNHTQLPSKVETSPRAADASNEIDKVKPYNYAQLPSKVKTSSSISAVSNEIGKVEPNDYAQVPSKVETSPGTAGVSNEIDRVQTNKNKYEISHPIEPIGSHIRDKTHSKVYSPAAATHANPVKWEPDNSQRKSEKHLETLKEKESCSGCCRQIERMHKFSEYYRKMPLHEQALSVSANNLRCPKRCWKQPYGQKHSLTQKCCCQHILGHRGWFAETERALQVVEIHLLDSSGEEYVDVSTDSEFEERESHTEYRI